MHIRKQVAKSEVAKFSLRPLLYTLRSLRLKRQEAQRTRHEETNCIPLCTSVNTSETSAFKLVVIGVFLVNTEGTEGNTEDTDKKILLI
jgi:hypothetical protein